MPKVGLVASQNGLGHARRLSHFSAAFLELGYEVHLFISDFQAQALGKEIVEICPKTIVQRIEGQGLDGPAQSSSEVNEVPHWLQKMLMEFSFVVSDNLTWPGGFLDSFILMGHFSWIDYWTISHSKSDIEIEKAIDHARKISKWYSPVDFSQIPTTLSKIDRVEIPLSRYISDPTTFHQPSLARVTFSNGATGLNKLDEKVLRADFERLGLTLVTKESHKYIESEIPALTLGRPGLGTIRDCLAMGIAFLPCWEGEDPELEANQDTLKRIGLVPASWEGNQKPNMEIIREFLGDATFPDRIRDYWRRNSAPIIEILPKMGF
jgi:hypothetical protein